MLMFLSFFLFFCYHYLPHPLHPACHPPLFRPQTLPPPPRLHHPFVSKLVKQSARAANYVFKWKRLVNVALGRGKMIGRGWWNWNECRGVARSLGWRRLWWWWKRRWCIWNQPSASQQMSPPGGWLEGMVEGVGGASGLGNKVVRQLGRGSVVRQEKHTLQWQDGWGGGFVHGGTGHGFVSAEDTKKRDVMVNLAQRQQRDGKKIKNELMSMLLI